MEINSIFNKKYNTDKGYLILIDILKQKGYKINEDNLTNLKINNMSKESFKKTGYVGIYKAKSNSIDIFTNKDDEGNIIFKNVNFTDEEIINTFLHEFIHALSTKIDSENNMILEGINFRELDNNNSSFFLGINEGLTQMITNDVLGEDITDAYPFQTVFAKQLTTIIGKDEIQEMYFTNDSKKFIDTLNGCFNNDMDKTQDFVIKSYIFYMVCCGEQIDGAENLGTELQNYIIEMSENKNKQEEIKNMILTKEEIKEYGKMLPFDATNISKFGFENYGEIKVQPKFFS